MITVLDFETTGLPRAIGSDLSIQPHATELYAQQMTPEGELVKEFDSLIKPGAPIPKFLEKIIGITNEMVADAPAFIDLFDQIVDVFVGSRIMVAHNLSFDLKIMIFELQRIGKEHNFPFPPIHFCTMEQSTWIKGKKLKNGDLYKHITGEDIVGAHRGKADVLATKENYLWLVKQKG